LFVVSCRNDFLPLRRFLDNFTEGCFVVFKNLPVFPNNCRSTGRLATLMASSN